MAKLILLLLFLFVLFGYGPGAIPEFPTEGERGEAWRVERERVDGNERYQVRERGDRDLLIEFREQITGNASVELEAEDGSIYVKFADKIAGNPSVSLKTTGRGSIYVMFGGVITGNPKVTIDGGGDVVFLNDEETIAGYREQNLITINARGRVRYRRSPGLFTKGAFRAEGCAIVEAITGT